MIDYGDVMVHLFDAEARGYWDIEQLWNDAKPVPLPAEVEGRTTPSSGDQSASVRTGGLV